MPPVQFLPFGSRDPVRPVLQAGIQMKGSPDPVLIHDPHQTAVLQPSVVIAQCERLVFSPGKTDVMNFVILHEISLLPARSVCQAA